MYRFKDTRVSVKIRLSNVIEKRNASITDSTKWFKKANEKKNMQCRCAVTKRKQFIS